MSAKEYSDKNCKEISWLGIGEIMYENWFHLESAERDEKGKMKHLFFFYFLIPITSKMIYYVLMFNA